MKLIARQRIAGANDDFDLVALDGIKVFEALVDDFDELVELFIREYPGFNAMTYELVEE